MYLRKIVIKGFKSFPDLTQIETHQGVTCIVGPNGCGKSNISDAVRWVLGEQSPRKLRGRNMADMIFAGTSNRRREGMASVTVHLDNSTGYFASPYTELEISRELFGSGESNYVINGNKVRLTDVLELFMDRGVGVDTYSIIEQGQVARIMDAKPEERRAIIEEAAGIVKYQTRREKCERKLRRVQLDIERLHDIIAELERQVRSLRQQASRAKRYHELYDRLRGLEIVTYCEEHVRRTAEIEALNAKLTELVALSEQLAARREALEAELEAAQQARAEADTALAELRDRRLTLEGEASGANERIQLYRRQEEEQKGRLEQLEREREEVAERLRQLVEQQAQAELRVKEVGREVEVLKERLAETEAAFEAQRQTVARREREHGEAREEAYRIESRITTLANDLRQIEREEGLAGVRRERQVATLDGVRSEAEGVRAEVSRLHTQLEAHQATRNDATSEKSRTEGTLSEVQERLDAGEEQLASVVGMLQAKRVRLESLETMQRNLEGYRRSVVELLQRREQGDAAVQAILGTVAGHVHVEREHARAIEAALGEGLQSLVAESGAPVETLLSTTSGGGRLSIICLDKLRMNGIPPVPADLPFPATPAKTLVTAETPFDVVVEALLDGVYLVDRIGPCLEVLERIPTGVRFVTREGVLFDVRGLVSGGDGEGAGILARQREIEELHQEIQALDAERVDVEELCTDLHRRRHDLRERMQTIIDRQYQIDIELATAKKELAVQLRDADRLAQEEATLKQEIGQIDEDLRRLSAARDTTRAGLEEANRNKEEAAQAVAETGEALRLATAERDEIQGQLAARRVTLGERTKDLQMAEREVEQTRATAEELGKRQETMGTVSAQVQEALGRTVAEREALEERLKVLYCQVEELDRKIQDAQYVVAERTEACQKQRAAVNEVSTAREQNQRAISDKELNLTRGQVELESLHRRLRDTYGMSVEEAMAARAEALPDEGKTLEETAADLRDRLQKMGAINECALEDYERTSQELEFKTAQVKDLEEAKTNLERTIRGIRRTTRERFLATFEQVREHFQAMFRRIFGGGRADLILLTSDEVDVMDAGIEIVAQPPGKNLQSITLMSGGERAMSAVALLFSLYEIKPSPFCFLDEIDAPLDDANIGRFCRLLQQFTDRTQFVIVTHNKRTMEMADRIYGVTMQEDGISRLVSIEFETRRDGTTPRLRMNGPGWEQTAEPEDAPAEAAAPESAPEAETATAHPEGNGNGNGNGNGGEHGDRLVEASLDEVLPDSASARGAEPMNRVPSNGHTEDAEPADADADADADPSSVVEDAEDRA